MQLEDFEQTVQLDDKHVFLSYAPNDMIVPQKNFGDLKVIWKIQAVSLKYMKFTWSSIDARGSFSR